VDGVAGERRFVGAGLAVWVARAGVPGARHDALVVGDLLVLDDDPVGEVALGGAAAMLNLPLPADA
jgi:hypothetical protein